MTEQAFPDPHRTDIKGMSLRDYFAAKAMQALITHYGNGSRIVEEDGWSKLAFSAYDHADMMMEARK